MRNDLPHNVMDHTRWDRAPRYEVIAQYLIAASVPTLVAYAIAYIGVTAVTSWALRALSPTPDFGSFGSTQGLLVNTRTATAPQEVVYGTVRKGGVVTYVESTGDTNKYLHYIICLAGHEVNAINDVYINDQIVTIGSDYFVSDTRWKDADGNAKVYVRKFEGTDTQNIYNSLNSITNPPEWKIGGNAPTNNEDTNFKGEGIACLYVRMEYDQTVFAEGIPLFTAVVQGKKVYDPRASASSFSANAALCIRDYLTSDYGVDNTGDTNDTVFSAAANTCDESVALSGGGTEKRYELNGVISLDRSPSDILADLMTACAGTLFWGQGKWQLKVGEYTTPVKTFTLDDFRSGINLQTKHSRRDNFNIVRGMFNSAANNYVRSDYPEIRGSTFISNDANVESALDYHLPFTTSASMAQRLAKMTLFRAREQMTLTAEFSLDAFNVQVGDIVSITNARYGFSAKEFEVAGWKFSNDASSGELKVGLTLRETSSSAFSWSAEESDIDSNNSTLTDSRGGLTINNLTASGGGSTQSDGTFINSVILSWTAAQNTFVSFYEIDYKPTADSSFSSATTPDTSIEISPIIDSVEYTIRVRAVTASGVKGAYSTITFTGGGDTTAPALPTSITAVGGFKYIDVNWTNPADNDLNFVEVYESATNSSSGAALVGISAGSSFTRTNLGLNQTRYYFLKSVDYSGNKSAFTSSVNATTTYLDDPDFENGVRQIFIDAGLDIIQPVASLPSAGDYTNQQVFLTSDNKLYYWTGSAWSAVVSDATVSAGSITATEIADGAISTPKLAANVVTAAKIAGNTITANEIAANTITGGLLAASGIITSSAQIQDGLITNAKIANAAITNAKINDLSADKITAGTITADRFIGAGIAKIVNQDVAYSYTGSSQIYNTSIFNISLSGLTSGSAVLVGFSGRIEATGSGNNNPYQATISLNLGGVTQALGSVASGTNLTHIRGVSSSGTSVSVSMTATSARRFIINGSAFAIAVVQ